MKRISGKGQLLGSGIRWAAKAEAQLDLLFTNKEELIGNVMMSFTVGCSDCETMGFEIQRGASKQIVEHKRADFRLFKE